MGEVTKVALHSKMWTACLKDYSVCMSRPVVNQLRRGLLSIMDNKSCVKPKYPLVCVCVCVCNSSVHPPWGCPRRKASECIQKVQKEACVHLLHFTVGQGKKPV